MATRADVRRIAEASRQISGLARQDVRRLWATLDMSSPLGVRAALEELLPDLVTAYGDMSATVAADWYDEMRDQAGARGAFRAQVAAPTDAAAVRANARWSIDPLFSATPDPDAALARLALETDRMVLQSGRSTRVLSAARDPAKPRLARVPTSSAPCAFCTTLASRGAVFVAESRAAEFHANCGCELTPIHDGEQLPEGYDPDRLREDYDEARRQAGSGDLKSVLSKMRELQGIN